MRSIEARPLTGAAFRPYGDVIEGPSGFERIYVSDALANGRPAARPSLSVARIAPLSAPRLEAVKLERHEFSSQSFLPLDCARYLVIVAPRLASGGPDESRLEAFIARGDQAITYGMNVWHHPMTVLDRPARFAITMWLDGGKGDEEFRDLAEPVVVTATK